MAGTAAPLDIAPSGRFGSSSPRNQASNLTSALQQAGDGAYQSGPMNIGQPSRSSDNRLGVNRQESMSNGLGYSGSGARPISVNQKPRRESMAGSLLNGMSWGGVSMGSWIRDDVIMAGTSPGLAFQSPSYHSSSYLPKMEANFMKDFECCGITLDSLHELLQHYEEVHANQQPQYAQQPQQSSRAGSVAVNGPNTSMTMGQNSQSQGFPQQSSRYGTNAQYNTNQFRAPSMSQYGRGTTLSTVQDDPLDDMELDDAQPAQPVQQMQQAFGRQQAPPINVNVANTMHGHQGLRTSAPTTPMASQAGFPLQNNPTVSSVNTPALSTQSLQQPNRTSPDSSVPGTPGELDQEFNGGFYGNLNGLPLDQQFLQNTNIDWNNINLGVGDGLSNLTIDEPAKRLFSKQGGFGGNQMSNSELAKRLREQQLMAGMPGGPMGFPGEENKPFKCPVIGCEKAYKNQNGLKYHKQHGHQNQQLKENGDGTFSIVDPVTSIPYPGTVGMEKEKPYRCEVCGKRYKNLNGLKYHRQHSPPCNPDLKMPNGLPFGAGLGGAMNVNVAGAGLVGMGGDF